MGIVEEIEALYDEASTAISGAAEAVLVSRIHRLLEEAAHRAPDTPDDMYQLVRLLHWLVRNSEMERSTMETLEVGLMQALGDKAEPHLGEVAERILESVGGGATVH